MVLSNAAFEPGIIPHSFSAGCSRPAGAVTLSEWPLLLNGDLPEWRHTTIANTIDIWLTLGIGAIPRSPLITRMQCMLAMLAS